MTKHYPHMKTYVEKEYFELLSNDHVAQNIDLHDKAENLAQGSDPESNEIPYDFSKYLDTLSHREKADISNIRAGNSDWKAMTWANSQHSPECGSWLKGRSRDFYPFPNSHTHYMNTLTLLMSSKRPTQPFYCPCSSKVDIRSDPWHCLDCKYSHYVRTKCHTKILDALTDALSTVGKVTGSPRLTRGSEVLYTDLQFIKSTDMTTYLLDAVSVNPTAAKYLSLCHLGSVDRASSMVEAEKRRVIIWHWMLWISPRGPPCLYIPGHPSLLGRLLASWSLVSKRPVPKILSRARSTV